MGWHLRTYDQAPPGGYPYSQNGVFFASQPLIEAQAQIVSVYRKGNNLSRSSVAEALADVDLYTCQRLGYMPEFCANSDAPPGAASYLVATGGKCRGCGVVLK